MHVLDFSSSTRQNTAHNTERSMFSRSITKVTALEALFRHKLAISPALLFVGHIGDSLSISKNVLVSAIKTGAATPTINNNPSAINKTLVSILELTTREIQQLSSLGCTKTKENHYHSEYCFHTNRPRSINSSRHQEEQMQ